MLWFLTAASADKVTRSFDKVCSKNKVQAKNTADLSSAGDEWTGLDVTRECVRALLGDKDVLGASDKSKVKGLDVSESRLTDDTSDNLTKTCRQSELAEPLSAK